MDMYFRRLKNAHDLILSRKIVLTFQIFHEDENPGLKVGHLFKSLNQ